VVNRPLRSAVGAHYGWKDFLVQRVSAIVMVLYTLLLLGIALYSGGIDHAQWQSLFGNGVFSVATLVFGVALAWHAWIGMRDIWMDYVKPTAARLTLEVLTVVVLAAYVAWLVQILWGRS
jgi:succinate dehydrogenase / fumarate reductase membrane anchor subunit